MLPAGTEEVSVDVDALDAFSEFGAVYLRALLAISDRGSQYTSAAYGELCDRLGVAQSMGATGVCWDNAAAESFFGTLKRELAGRRRWATRADARRDLIRWIEGWFNTRRFRSSLDYHSPAASSAGR